MSYRFEAPTIEGFIQQVAVQYVSRGYWFYVSGFVPAGKDPHAVAAKLIAKYDIVASKFVRARRKAAGRANLQLILHGRFFLILATHGEHPFYAAEKSRLRDCREAPIRYASYAIGFRGGHVQVRIDRDTERDLKAFFRQSALWTQDRLEKEFWSLPFEPYAPVRRQILVIFNQVNRLRREAGFEALRTSCLRFRRKPCKPFQERFQHPVEQFGR